MANIRVKDLPNTNAANDNDEFIVDSSTSGTRRLSYAELKSEISTDFAADVATYGIATLDSDNKLTASQIPDSLAQGMNFVGVANSAGDLTSTTQGDFYVIQTAFGVYSVGDQAVYDGSAYVRVVDGTKEITEGGTGATTLDDAKGNLEIPGVGTDPSQVPLNQHLGSMAYQSSEGISVGTLEVTDKVGIGTNSGSRELTIGDGTGSPNMQLLSSNSGLARIEFGDPDDGDAGELMYDHSNNKLTVNTAGSTAVTIDSSQRVGIGDTSPDNKLTIGEGNIQLQGNKPPNVEVYHINWKNTNSTGFDVARIAAATGANIYEGELRFMTKDSGGTMATRWSISPAGNLVSSGGAIDFGSTVFDTYEEGTHATTVSVSSSGSVTLDSNNNTLGYTITGNKVSITGLLKISSVSSPVGVLVATLPSAIANLANGAGAGGGAASFYDASLNSYTAVPITFDEGNSSVAIRLDASTLGASDQIRLSFVYFQA